VAMAVAKAGEVMGAEILVAVDWGVGLSTAVGTKYRAQPRQMSLALRHLASDSSSQATGRGRSV
jgi:predicted metal-dependent TIM-barrel fold hydrolase